MYSGVKIYPDIAAERQTLILQLFLNFATFLLHAQTIKAKTGNNKQPLTTLVIICSLQNQSREGLYSQVATSFQQWMDWDAKLLLLWRSSERLKWREQEIQAMDSLLRHSLK
jgi:hypothetical protein